MRIERITSANLSGRMDALVRLADEFLASVGAESERSADEKKSIITQMIDAQPTEVFIVLEEEIPVGLSYFNIGSGYACGGVYLWINCLYVDENHRGKGLGSFLLSSIEEFGLSKGARLIMSTRDRDNVLSEAVFSKLDYSEELNPIISKITISPDVEG